MKPIFLAGVLCLLAPAAVAEQGCPVSSRAFAGSPVDAPFFVFDGGSPGAGLGQYGAPAAIAAIHEGWRSMIAVADAGNDRIHVMTDQGFFQDYWGGKGSGSGSFLAPGGLAMSPEGDLWVADTGNHRLQKLRALRQDVAAVLGQPILVVGRRGHGPGELERPSGLAVDSRGNVYVADTGNHRIQKLGPNSRFLASWGGRGSAPGRFESPSAVAVGPGDVLYVSDTGNHRVQVFDAAGRFLRQWGRRGKEPGAFDGPRGLALDGAGNVYVADAGNDRIQKLAPSGTFLAEAGCPGSEPGQFDGPVALAFDLDGYLYVVDAGNHRIQKLGPP